MNRIDLSGFVFLAFVCVGAFCGLIAAIIAAAIAVGIGAKFSALCALAIVAAGGAVGAMIYWRAGAK